MLTGCGSGRGATKQPEREERGGPECGGQALPCSSRQEIWGLVKKTGCVTLLVSCHVSPILSDKTRTVKRCSTVRAERQLLPENWRRLEAGASFKYRSEDESGSRGTVNCPVHIIRSSHGRSCPVKSREADAPRQESRPVAARGDPPGDRVRQQDGTHVHPVPGPRFPRRRAQIRNQPADRSCDRDREAATGTHPADGQGRAPQHGDSRRVLPTQSAREASLARSGALQRRVAGGERGRHLLAGPRSRRY